VGTEHAEKAISIPTMWKTASIVKVPGRGEEEIHALYMEGNKWPSFIGNHWHFHKHLIWWVSGIQSYVNTIMICAQIGMYFTGYIYTIIMYLEMLCSTSDPLATC